MGRKCEPHETKMGQREVAGTRQILILARVAAEVANKRVRARFAVDA
jgi:hypothetical protein